MRRVERTMPIWERILTPLPTPEAADAAAMDMMIQTQSRVDWRSSGFSGAVIMFMRSRPVIIWSPPMPRETTTPEMMTTMVKPSRRSPMYPKVWRPMRGKRVDLMVRGRPWRKDMMPRLMARIE